MAISDEQILKDLGLLSSKPNKISDEQVLADLGITTSSYSTEPTEKTFSSRVAEAHANRTKNVGETMEQMGNWITEQYKGITGNANYNQLLEPMKVGEEGAVSPAKGAVRILGQTLNFGFDIVGAGIAETAETAWDLIPKDYKEMISGKTKALMNSEVGKTLLEGIKEGGSFYSELKKQYPSEMKDMEAALSIVSAGPSRLREVLPSQLGKEVVPYGVKVVDKTGKKTWLDPDAIDVKNAGMRQINEPLKGTDKDLFHIIQDTSKAGKTEAAKGGKTTSPQGLMGRKEQLATNKELNAIDAMKRTKGVKGANTLQENLNLMNARERNLNKTIESKLAKNDLAYTPDDMAKALDDSLADLMQGNAGKFNSKLDPSDVANPRNMINQAMIFLQQNGTNALGIHKARKAFDDYYRKVVEKAYKDGTVPEAATLSADRIRKTLNDAVDSLDSSTKAMRQEQSSLIFGMDRIAPKAADEAATRLGRAIQRTGLHAGSTFGSGALNAVLTPLAVIAGGVVRGTEKITKGAISGMMREKLGYGLRDLRKELIRMGNKIKTAEGRAELNAELKVINMLIEEEEKAE